MISKKLAAFVALAMVSASSAAVAQSAQSLSIAHAPAVRAAAASERAGDLDDRNGIGIYVIGAVVLAALIWGVIELTKKDEGPSSP